MSPLPQKVTQNTPVENRPGASPSGKEMDRQSGSDKRKEVYGHLCQVVKHLGLALLEGTDTRDISHEEFCRMSRLLEETGALRDRIQKGAGRTGGQEEGL